MRLNSDKIEPNSHSGIRLTNNHKVSYKKVRPDLFLNNNFPVKRPTHMTGFP